MNKRQCKKRIKIVTERFKYVNKSIMISGRQNGKTKFIKAILKACLSKKYKYFKALQKPNLFIAIDLSNNKDFSAISYYRRENGVIKIAKTELF
ncbi:hypothetical protein [Clostridium intestinale]|uniref:Uncharacterized protein n=1 Tax=Clostridium intestinale TaxID=36845 RepID=A0A7D6ZR93_9CLOT|nr:hypothetical protein [Clostridium intestinale]QLY77813.1 hypothetical protein HZF06_11885 [Clostridium intestinale]